MKSRSHYRRNRPALYAFLAIAFFSQHVAARAKVFSIPSGQEELILDMLGRGHELPDGCTLNGVTTDIDVIVATYSCGERRPVLELRHPHTRVDGLRTKQFVVIAAGDAVPGLLPGLAPVIEHHEPSFRWLATKPVQNPDAQRDPPAQATPNRSTAVRSGLLGVSVSLALISWAAWRERNLERRQRA